jgi:mono/diheme cytochrome c family protein
MSGRALTWSSLALYLSALAAAIASAPQQPLHAQAGTTVYRDVYDGWKWWHVYCFRCHGQDAIATSTAPNLIDPNAKLTDAEFLKVVRNGRPDKGMQAWDKLLDDKQIGQLHMYVRARTDKILPPGRPDEVGPNKGPWVPPSGWPKK